MISEGPICNPKRERPNSPKPGPPPSQVPRQLILPSHLDMNGVRPLVLALDFDGTITGCHFGQFRMDRPPAEGCIEVVNEFYNDGCAHILWTCREKQDGTLYTAIDYMHKWDIPFHVANEGIKFAENGWGSCRKVYADFYIDDLGILGFPGWYETKKIVQAHPLYGRYKNVAV